MGILSNMLRVASEVQILFQRFSPESKQNVQKARMHPEVTEEFLESLFGNQKCPPGEYWSYGTLILFRTDTMVLCEGQRTRM